MVKHTLTICRQFADSKKQLHHSGESLPDGLSKTLITKTPIKTKYKKANKHRKQNDTKHTKQ